MGGGTRHTFWISDGGYFDVRCWPEGERSWDGGEVGIQGAEEGELGGCYLRGVGGGSEIREGFGPVYGKGVVVAGSGG